MKPILAAMLSVSGLELTDVEKRLLSEANPMGVTLFRRNVADKEQVKALTQEIKEIIGREDVLVAVDQEGGRVCRFARPKWPKMLSQSALGSLNIKKGVELAELHAALIAKELRKLGVNWNYAPVLDVAYPKTTRALASRIFSANEKKVAELGGILLDTYQAYGICPCVKHLPGHGRAEVDPHLNLPVVNADKKELEKDFYPFQALAGRAPAGMTAHLVLSAYDDKPATQSEKVIREVIRGIIGFDGFLISDAIDMRALKGSLTEKTETSLAAGCDAVCYCFGEEEGLNEVVKAAKPLTDNALERLQKIKDILNVKPPRGNASKMRIRYHELGAKAKPRLASDYDAVETLHKMKG